MRILKLIILLLITTTLSNCKEKSSNVVTKDIDNFWNAYDKITTTNDTILQYKYLDSLYLKKGSPGLLGIIKAKKYKKQDFLNMIQKYPKFLQSIRSNTYKSKQLANELENGVTKLKAIYPTLSPAKIYFTIGAMRSGGTTLDSLVLIGSELAMVDENTDISEFKGALKKWVKNYIATKPLENIVLLNTHEYIHTQQSKIPSDLLYQCLYEGVAEFVSVKAMNTPSTTPAIEYGKKNSEVKKVFEKKMFYNYTSEWLWSNKHPENLEQRDLGYYIGYAIAEKHYNNSTNKQQAIKELIELDYSKLNKVDKFIDNTGYFSKSINELREESKKIQPTVLKIKQFKNGATNVNSNTEYITINFSAKLNGYNTGVNYSDLGENAFPKIISHQWNSDSTSWTLKVKLEPNKHYKYWVTSNFKTKDNIPLLPYLIEFKTKPM